ncbi:MAG: ester cyclase [Actinomycetota bacterium]|nr:ester cyclase [Actinomycetota bacterium]
MPGEDLKRVVRRYYDEVFTRRNIAALDELFAPGFVGHSATVGSYTLSDMRRDIAREHETMPEDEVVIKDQVAEGDRVVTRFSYRWKHDQSVFGEPPSGRWITMEGVQIDRLEAGKIAERWEIKDQWGVATQLGAKAEFPR